MQEITENYTTEVKNRFSDLEIEERTPDEIWQEMKEIILEEAEKSVPKNKKRQKTKWITANTIRIAKDRKDAKVKKNLEDYQLNAEFQRKAREDKELYLNEQCNLMDNGSAKTKDFFYKDQGSHREVQAKVGILKSKEGKDLVEEAEIKKYMERIY